MGRQRPSGCASRLAWPTDWGAGRRRASHVHVGHRWPPRLEGPADEPWVLMQPWEFGSLPKAWLPALHLVDEIWAYSRSVRDCYLEAGMPSDRVHVMPLGVDPEIFRPGLEPLEMHHSPEFRFLFVGGTIFRKGIDVLLSAFARAFPPHDGVGLVIKDMGTKSFYRGQTAEAKVAALRERGYSVEYIDRDLDESEIAKLYAACDCLVHPFRGEGFALPVVEAMACGLPVIVTGAGPVLDYASEETAFLIPARRGNFAECRVGKLETIGRPWLWEPDMDALVEHLRSVVAERPAARAKGKAASEWIRERFTWARSAEAIEKRLHVLASRSDFEPDSPLHNGLACPSPSTVTMSPLPTGPSACAAPPPWPSPTRGEGTKSAAFTHRPPQDRSRIHRAARPFPSNLLGSHPRAPDPPPQPSPTRGEGKNTGPPRRARRSRSRIPS